MTKPTAFNPRTARQIQGNENGPFYVVIKDAPNHYIDGYGYCGPGAIVTLKTGVGPGKYLVEVSASDAAKAGESEQAGLALAAMAKAKKDAGKADADGDRKEKLDERTAEQRLADDEAAAKREAEAAAEAVRVEAERTAALEKAAGATPKK